MPNYRQISESLITIGGTRGIGVTMPCFSWDIDIGTYGQIGHARARTAISFLTKPYDSQGNPLPAVNIYQITSSQIHTPVYISMNGITLFGGNLLHAHYNFEEDEVEITARDFSSVLFDTKSSVASLPTGYANQTVSTFITNICTANGLTPAVNINPNNDPYVGTIFDQTGITQGTSYFSSYPRTLWSIVVLLARSVGAQVYSTPDGKLHVETISANPVIVQNGQSQTAWQYIWRPTPIADPGAVLDPILRLEVLHQPELNKNFTVIVQSHHQKSAQSYTVQLPSLGTSIDISTGLVRSGIYTANSTHITSLLSTSNNGKLVLFIHLKDGQTLTQALAYAQGVALQIASKLVVMTVTIDGNPDLRPNNPFQILENVSGSLAGFNAKAMYISEVKHSFHVPQGETVGTEGYLSTVKLLSVPPTLNPMNPDEIATLTDTAEE